VEPSVIADWLGSLGLPASSMARSTTDASEARRA